MADSLVDRLGGRDGVSRAVYALYDRLANDDATAGYFEDVKLTDLRAHMTDFLLAALTGRDGVYRGRPLDQAHRGVGVTDLAFDRTVHHLVAVLTEAGVVEPDVTTIVDQLAPLRSLVVV